MRIFVFCLVFSQQEHGLDFKDHGFMIVGCGPYHKPHKFPIFASFFPTMIFIFHQPHSCIVFISFNEQLVQERVRAALRSTPPQTAACSLTLVLCQASALSDRWASVQWW